MNNECNESTKERDEANANLLASYIRLSPLKPCCIMDNEVGNVTYGRRKGDTHTFSVSEERKKVICDSILLFY